MFHFLLDGILTKTIIYTIIVPRKGQLSVEFWDIVANIIDDHFFWRKSDTDNPWHALAFCLLDLLLVIIGVERKEKASHWKVMEL